jgi:hypothetical protein
VRLDPGGGAGGRSGRAVRTRNRNGSSVDRHGEMFLTSALRSSRAAEPLIPCPTAVGGIAVGANYAGLVGDDDQLDPVPGAELGQ